MNPLAKPSSTSALRSLCLCGALLLLAGPAARGQEAATAKDAVAAIAAAEAAGGPRKLTLTVTDRRAEYRNGEALEDSRKRVAATPAFVATGTLVYGPDGWLKDLQLTSVPGARGAIRTRTSTTDGILRNLVEAVGGEGPKRARVLKVGSPVPADVLLTRRAGAELGRLQWTAARPSGDTLTLEGTQGKDRHVVTLTRGDRPQVRSWRLVRELEAPSGARFDQTYLCEVTPGSEPWSIEKVEEWVLNPPPLGNVTYRITEVKDSEPLAGYKPEEVRLRFPAGTEVTDARGEVPVEYVETATGINEADVATTARALAQGRVRPGDTVPPFELKDVRGKVVRMEDFKDKVLLLFWFNSRSKPAEAAAKFIGDLQGDYKKRGFQVIALSVAEEGDAAKTAEAFGKRFKWSFPILVDDEGEAMRRYGLETGVPKVAVIDRDGKLAYVQPGVDVDTITEVLNRVTGK